MAPIFPKAEGRRSSTTEIARLEKDRPYQKMKLEVAQELGNQLPQDGYIGSSIHLIKVLCTRSDFIK
ncbi:protein of unknown function [Paenibacillus alvei]|uniref:Uncharacterized protein n=1 Tax=Paenibacillus alvei TaxID=44250 RepID=A0A383R8V0_PAEAL|nr:protein of unknown function [Paenibacillus alvei]